jgi:uncharacterized protein (DUF2235 family)
MKRLIICADGTWNERDQINSDTGRPRPTNVTKVARAIRPRSAAGVDQVVFYHDGIGTRGPLDRVTGGAFGGGMERNIRNLYRFVVYNFEPGDELYLFGFSRGAFTVRSLAGFMRFIGLIQKDDDYFLPELYACYEKAKGPGTPEWKEAFRDIRDVRPCPPIAFIGVWDTVGALGAPGLLGQLLNPGKYKYHDVELNDHILRAYQALAIDERRRPFKPNPWQAKPGWTGRIEQAWFAGVHSNIGGGYAPDGLANEALHWIVGKAEACGLQLDDDYLAFFRPCFNSELKDSMTLLYRLMPPITRRVGDPATSGECVHQSVLDRLRYAPSDYNPPTRANLEQLPVVGTSRIARGEACE